MLETKWLQPEGEITVMDAPFLGKIKKFPFAAALAAAVIMSVLF